jgi:hypothetical protein
VSNKELKLTKPAFGASQLNSVFDGRTEGDVTGRGWVPDETVEPDRTGLAPGANQSWMDRMRSGERLANGAIVVILALFLLPLVVGPFVAAWQFARAGQYAGALFIVSLFGCLALVAIRAVRRGEFGPGVFFLAVGLIIGATLLGALFARMAAPALDR